MITFDFGTAHPVLSIRFQEFVTNEDLLSAFALYDDSRFTRGHHVLFDSRGSELRLTHDAFETVEREFGYKNQRGRNTRTAFVVDQDLKRAITALARGVREDWGTYWKFFDTPDDAFAWLIADEVGDVDFGPTMNS